MKESIKTAFFDLDDTMLDHSGAERNAIKGVGDIYHPAVAPETFYRVWTEKSRENWTRFERGELTFEQQRLLRIRNIWSTFGYDNIRDSETEDALSQYLDLYEQNWSLFPDVEDCLQKLSSDHITLGVISNGSLSQQIRKLRATNVFRHFREDLIIISEAVGVSKPDPNIFLIAQQRADRSPSEIVYFGDDIKKDMESPHSLSWNVVLVDRKNQFQNQALPYQVVQDLRTL